MTLAVAEALPPPPPPKTNQPIEFNTRQVEQLHYMQHGNTLIILNSTGKIGRIGWHLAEKSDVKVMMCFGPMPPDASDFPGGIPAIILRTPQHIDDN